MAGGVMLHIDTIRELCETDWMVGMCLLPLCAGMAARELTPENSDDRTEV